MNFLLFLTILLLSIVLVAGQYPQPSSSYPAAPFYASFCDRYTSQLGLDYTNPQHEWAFMTMISDRAYSGVAMNGSAWPPAFNDVTGLIHNQVTAQYFDGQIQSRYPGGPLPPPTPNFNESYADLQILGHHIAELFGVAFGCNATNYTTLYPYSGVNDFAALHSHMNIGQVVFLAFINQFSLACTSLGVSNYDFQNIVVPFLQEFGRGAQNKMQICSASDCNCATGYGGSDCSTVLSSTGPTAIVPGSTGPNAAYHAQQWALYETIMWMAITGIIMFIARH